MWVDLSVRFITIFIFELPIFLDENDKIHSYFPKFCGEIDGIAGQASFKGRGRVRIPDPARMKISFPQNITQEALTVS